MSECVPFLASKQHVYLSKYYDATRKVYYKIIGLGPVSIFADEISIVRAEGQVAAWSGPCP